MFDEKEYCHPKGARDAEGRFEPFYIPRPVMPQVHHHDYPELLDFLTERGIGWEYREIDATELIFHQRVNEGLVKTMPPKQERKPVLVSGDLYVIDGNHRVEKHREDGTPAKCVLLHAPFTVAIEAVFAFPKTFTLDERG